MSIQATLNVDRMMMRLASKFKSIESLLLCLSRSTISRVAVGTARSHVRTIGPLSIFKDMNGLTHKEFDGPVSTLQLTHTGSFLCAIIITDLL